MRGPDPERRRGFRKEFDLLEASTATFADSFIEEIQRATEEGAFSFTRFADSAIRDLTRILQQQVLSPQLAKWGELALNAGIKLVGGIFGGGAGAGAAANLGTALGGTGGLQFGQTGGPLRRGLTLVGEAGPEAIATRGGRSIVFPTSHPVTRAAMRSAGVPRRQYGGPLPSAVMGGTGSEMAGTTMSSTGSARERPIIVIMNITTPDAASFVRSKGEIARSFQQAIRGSQRS